jgi:hypothetical protein
VKTQSSEKTPDKVARSNENEHVKNNPLFNCGVIPIKVGISFKSGKEVILFVHVKVGAQ